MREGSQDLSRMIFSSLANRGNIQRFLGDDFGAEAARVYIWIGGKNQGLSARDSPGRPEKRIGIYEVGRSAGDLRQIPPDIREVRAEQAESLAPPLRRGLPMPHGPAAVHQGEADFRVALSHATLQLRTHFTIDLTNLRQDPHDLLAAPLFFDPKPDGTGLLPVPSLEHRSDRRREYARAPRGAEDLPRLLVASATTRRQEPDRDVNHDKGEICLRQESRKAVESRDRRRPAFPVDGCHPPIWIPIHPRNHSHPLRSRESDVLDFARFSEDHPAVRLHAPEGGLIPLAVGRLSGNVPDDDPDDLLRMVAGDGAIDLGVLFP